MTHSTHLSEEDLILLYYSEPGVPPGARAHLAECRECRAAAESLAYTLNLCNEWNPPEPSADFGRDAWNRLVPELAAPELPHRIRLFSSGLFKAWAVTAACAAILAGAFFAGRFTLKTEPPVLAGLSDQARERILAIAVADHLDRVQVLMTEIADGGNANQETLAAEKERAADLVQEDRLMHQSLVNQGDNATSNFLDEVEAFLTETAHTPEAPNAGQLADLRDRIESESLLFKVRVVEANLRSNYAAEAKNPKEHKL